MKKNWPYLLFIPALFISYYLGSQSEQSFENDYLKKNGAVKMVPEAGNSIEEIKRDIARKQVEKLQAKSKMKKENAMTGENEDHKLPAMDMKSFVKNKQEALLNQDVKSGGEDNRDDVGMEMDDEQEVSSVLDDEDQRLLRDLASEMPEASEEITELMKSQKIKANDALKDNPDREAKEKDIAPLTDEDL